MYHIAPEDIGKIHKTIGSVLGILANGSKRVDLDVELGDGIDPIAVTGYWVLDIIRIDIKLKG